MVTKGHLSDKGTIRVSGEGTIEAEAETHLGGEQLKEASMLSPVSEGAVGEGGTEINVFPFRGELPERSGEVRQELLQSSGDHSGWGWKNSSGVLTGDRFGAYFEEIW